MLIINFLIILSLVCFAKQTKINHEDEKKLFMNLLQRNFGFASNPFYVFGQEILVPVNRKNKNQNNI